MLFFKCICDLSTGHAAVQAALITAFDFQRDHFILANWKERFSIIVDPNLDVTEEKADLARRVSCKSRKAVVLYLGDVTYNMGTLDCISFMDWTKLSSEVNYFS